MNDIQRIKQGIVPIIKRAGHPDHAQMLEREKRPSVAMQMLLQMVELVDQRQVAHAKKAEAAGLEVDQNLAALLGSSVSTVEQSTYDHVLDDMPINDSLESPAQTTTPTLDRDIPAEMKGINISASVLSKLPEIPVTDKGSKREGIVVAFARCMAKVAWVDGGSSVVPVSTITADMDLNEGDDTTGECENCHAMTDLGQDGVCPECGHTEGQEVKAESKVKHRHRTRRQATPVTMPRKDVVHPAGVQVPVEQPTMSDGMATALEGDLFGTEDPFELQTTSSDDVEVGDIVEQGDMQGFVKSDNESSGDYDVEWEDGKIETLTEQDITAEGSALIVDPSCPDFKNFSENLPDGGIPSEHRAALREAFMEDHITTCEQCQAYASDQVQMVAAADTPEDVDMGASVHDHIPYTTDEPQLSTDAVPPPTAPDPNMNYDPRSYVEEPALASTHTAQLAAPTVDPKLLGKVRQAQNARVGEAAFTAIGLSGNMDFGWKH